MEASTAPAAPASTTPSPASSPGAASPPAAPRAPSSRLLAAAASELSCMITKALAAPVGALNAQLEVQLQGVDEIAVLLDSSKADANVLLARLAAIAASTSRLQTLFALIERLEAATEAVTRCGQAGLARVAELEKGYEARYPQGFAKLTQRLFGGRGGAAALDAPVSLPPFDVTSVMYDKAGDVEAIREVLGSGGGRDRRGSSAVGGGEGEAAEGAEETGSSSSSSGGGVGSAAEAQAEATLEGVGDSSDSGPAGGSGGGAASSSSSSPPAPARRALARGEDDDDEDEDE